MEKENTQFNLRIPKVTAKAMRIASTMLDVPVQQLGVDAILVFYGLADQETMERQRKAVEAVRRAVTEEEWCAMQGSNLRPPPCQGMEVENSVRESDILPILRNDVLPRTSILPKLSSIIEASPLSGIACFA